MLLKFLQEQKQFKQLIVSLINEWDKPGNDLNPPNIVHVHRTIVYSLIVPLTPTNDDTGQVLTRRHCTVGYASMKTSLIAASLEVIYVIADDNWAK